MDDLLGKNGLIKNLIKNLTEKILKQELTEYLGYERHRPNNSNNSRNGYTSKRVKSNIGEIDIEIPRDRNSEFEPILIPKHKRELGSLGEKIISMYGKGMSVREINEHLEDIYGIKLSGASISRITEMVIEEVREWQNRPLESVYVIVYFDAIYYKVKEEGMIVNKAVYTCLGIDKEGEKDLLGMWVGESESAKFWLKVITELKNRGVRDILIACVDGLSGLEQAINSVYPETKIQLCVIHQIRNSLKYISYKDKKEFMKDLKGVYRGISREEGMRRLEEMEEKWGNRYGVVIRSWKEKWDRLSVYFDYSPEIRKLIYTTNILEGLHRAFRKYTKSKSIFPNNDSLLKSLYLAYGNLSKRWTQKVRDWVSIKNQLVIEFGDRLEPEI